MAGESAADVAQRRREKAERLLRQAEKWERGAAGEAVTARALASLPDEWVVRHDVAWPGRPKANLDHVAVGPPGIFVIDSKNWAARVYVNKDTLWCGRYPKTDQVEKAALAARAIADLVPTLAVGLVKPVLCFVQDKPLDDEVSGVRVCTADRIASVLVGAAPMLSSRQVDELAASLDVTMQAATAERAQPQPSVIESGQPAVRRRRSLGARLGWTAAMLALLVALPLLASLALRT